MSKLFKNLVTVSVAAATVGGLCYVFKDKIKESKVYQDYDVDTKLNKVKTTIKDKVPKIFDNEEDYFDDDEIFFEDEEFNPDNSSRDYVSISLEHAEASKDAETEETEESEETEKAVSNTASEDVPTIEV